MNIHIGNLSAQVTDNDLRTLFAAFGTVETTEVITNQRTGEPLGYGFVIMPVEAEALDAIATLNGKPWGGKILAVTKANRKDGKRKSRFPRK